MNDNAKFGVNVWWHVPETAVDVEVAHDALKKHGFAVNTMKAPSRRNEVSRAVRSLQDRRCKDEQTIARPTNAIGDSVTYGVLGEGHVDADTVEFKQDTTVRLDKTTGTVGIEGTRTEAVRTALDHFEGKITDEDIRAFLRRTIRSCRGVPKRPSGGIYFIPERFTALVERAQAVLDDMKSGAFLYVEGVVNGVRERQHVWTAVEADIERELDKTLKSVARIERSTRAVQGHQATVMGLQEMMEVYTDLLGKEAEHEAISERIAEAVGEVAHKLTDLQAGTAAKVKKVVASGKPRGSKVFDAAVDVLVSSGSAMHYRDIMNAMVAAGSYDGSYKSSDRSVNDVLRRRIAGGDTRVKIIGRGIYQVA